MTAESRVGRRSGACPTPTWAVGRLPSSGERTVEKRSETGGALVPLVQHAVMVRAGDLGRSLLQQRPPSHPGSAQRGFVIER